MPLDDLFGAVGGALEPLKPASDFLLPDTGPTGQDFSLSSLISSAGQGVQSALQEGPAALAAGAISALDPNSGMSVRDRVLIGGMTAFGSAMLGREAHKMWKARQVVPEGSRIWGAPAGRTPEPLDVPELGGFPTNGAGELVELGDRPRMNAAVEKYGWRALQQYPGMNTRQAGIVGANTNEEVIEALGLWDPVAKPEAPVHARVLFDEYQQMVGGSEIAQWDWAKFDLAVDRQIFPGSQNQKMRNLWKQLRTEPEKLFGRDGQIKPQALELLEKVKRFGDATDVASPDLSVGLVGRIERIEFADDDVVMFVRQPTGWTQFSATPTEVRIERLRSLNYRNLAEHGRYMLKTLYELGIRDWEAVQAGGTGRLPGKLEVGPEWYPTARNDVARVFGYEMTDNDDLARAVAAVSFLSEAEDWSTNIEKAYRVMNNAGVGDLEPEFLQYLKDPKAFGKEAGTVKAKAMEKRLDQLHALFTGKEYNPKTGKSKKIDGAEGFKVSKSDLNVVLRLMGRNESVNEIFASTARRKQKNFYLNIYHPNLDYPVTIDRHAFDAFLGFDTGINDRPIDMTLFDGDEVYDVVADVYRGLALELGVQPHELQAVIWEAWRVLKQDRYENLKGDMVARSGAWNLNDPFYLPNEGSDRNMVLEALNGHGVDAAAVYADSIPASVLDLETTGVSTMVMESGGGTVISEVTVKSAAQNRHLFPALEGVDRIPRWLRVRPNQVQSVSEVRGLVGTGDVSETFLASDLEKLGGHPLQIGGNHVVVEVPEGATIPQRYKAVDIGKAEIDTPLYELDPVDVNRIDPRVMMDPEASPLTNNRFVAFEHNSALRAALLREGYDVVDSNGWINDADEFAPLNSNIDGMTRGDTDRARGPVVSPDEWREYERIGNEQLAKYKADTAPPEWMDDNWDMLKEKGFNDSRKPWGGYTVNTHTGEFVDNSVERWSVTGRDPGIETVSVPVDASFEEFAAAMDLARERFAPMLERNGYYLGVFHDIDVDPPRIDIDPTIVVDTLDEVHTLGAATRAPGGAYNFKDENGYWPPYVDAGAQRSTVAFGVPPEVAQKLAKKYGLRSVLTNEGMLYDDGRFRPITEPVLGEAGPNTITMPVGGNEFSFRFDFGDDVENWTPSLSEARKTRVGRKMAITLPERSSRDIFQIAEEMEGRGFRNPAVYTTRDMHPGWERAYESLHSDGIQTTSTVSKTGDIASPNGGFVFRRHTSGFSDDAVIAPAGIDLDQDVIEDGLARATKREKGWQVEVDGDDAESVKAAIELRQKIASQDKVLGTVKVGGKTLIVPSGGKKPRTETVQIQNGMVAPRPRTDAPLEEFAAKHGINFDPAFRVGNPRQRLSDEVIAEVDELTTRFMESYGDAFRRAGFRNITVSPGMKGQFAVYSHEAQTIILSKEWWSDMPKMTAQLDVQRAERVLSPRVPSTPAGVVSHEFGHVIWGALRSSENWAKGSRLERDLGRLVTGGQSPSGWQKIATNEISSTAGSDPAELVAEAFSEVMAGNPSELSVRIVRWVEQELDTTLKVRRETIWR